MKKALLLLCIGISVLSNAQLTQESIEIEGLTRTYYRYLPTGYTSSENLPVVVVLHGLGDVASNMANAGFNTIADTARFIPVYLQGEPNSFSQNSWNNGTLLASTTNDVLFISEVIDKLEDSLDVDLSRVYCTGFSMGSIMSYKVASELSDRIAAIACFAGTMSDEEISAATPVHAVPRLHVHGTADATVPYDGSPLPSLSLVDATMTKNKALNGWAGDSTIYNLTDNVSDGITIEKIVYNCTTPLEHWKMTGADHIWPYQPANDTSAIFIAWYWFSQHQHANPSTADIATEISPAKIQVSPNPIQDQMIISLGISQSGYAQVDILDMLGRQIDNVVSGPLGEGNYQFKYNSAKLPKGVYFIKVSQGDAVKTQKLLKQ
jgi:polyhydroxybutyrate depolymerase